MLDTEAGFTDPLRRRKQHGTAEDKLIFELQLHKLRPESELIVDETPQKWDSQRSKPIDNFPGITSHNAVARNSVERPHQRSSRQEAMFHTRNLDSRFIPNAELKHVITLDDSSKGLYAAEQKRARLDLLSRQTSYDDMGAPGLSHGTTGQQALGAGSSGALVLVGSILGAVVLVAFLLFVVIKTRRRKATTPLTPVEPLKQQSLICPSVTVDLNQITQQQPPSLTAIHLVVPGESFITPQSAPIRIIKAKGLLERRGSNASLTIDLNHVETLHHGTPPKECSTEEFLTSAGNRLSRKQIRCCLKDLKSLRQEFVDIPLNHPIKLDIPGAGNKNRYRTIWPNEATRVILPPLQPNDVASTYMNANYIRGYDGEEKMYIATQGPLPHTITDFWRLVWMTRPPCIVMMTKLKEKNKIKCEQYLPTNEEIHGELRVTVRTALAKNGYYVRDVQLKHEPSGDIHSLKHYWFTAWPDHKAPASTAKALLELAQEVESERQKRLSQSNNQLACSQTIGPVIVHCSAGIGRTGCFIGVSIAMKQLQEENMVDVLGIVCQMRMDRGGMIQTVEQYEFLHHALIQFEKSLPDTPTSAGLPPNSAGSGSSQSSKSFRQHSNGSSSNGSSRSESKNSSKQSSPTEFRSF